MILTSTIQKVRYKKVRYKKFDIKGMIQVLKNESTLQGSSFFHHHLPREEISERQYREQ